VSIGAVSTWGAYGASKAAMNHLAGQLACEEPEVTSISVRPGVVDTEMQRELRDVHSAIMTEKDNEKFLGLHKRGQLLKPSDPGDVMAKMVLHPPRELNGNFVR
jgi:NAD(P)-dependent dehydrogenase (short-subunit alcohol dehydrogenase family)